MKKLLITTCILLSTLALNATPQVPDRLIFKGDTISLYPFLFNQYTASKELSDEALEMINDIRINSTAYWMRGGCEALFAIESDSLFLMGVYGKDNRELDLSKVFDKKSRIFCNWYSGVLEGCSDIRIMPMGFDRGLYSYEVDIYVEGGKVMHTEEFNNTIVESPFIEKGLDFIKNYLDNEIDYKSLPPVEDNIRVIVGLRYVSDPDGKISDDDVEIIKGHNEVFDKEALRVVKSIPQWRYVKRRGELYRRQWRVPIVFAREKSIEAKSGELY